MPEEIKLPEHIENALGYSRNYATAKPNIGNTEKEHILGLANLLEKTAAEANELRKVLAEAGAELNEMKASIGFRAHTIEVLRQIEAALAQEVQP
ncbi:hypothetical protein [Pseudomonas protegens]|uniref:hypothetical protein n=1 Tax=Pseudomonas protegens TaxID=380021 RepID=UPI0021602287|nr:hypothetical protein [Pseudomonas protegens]UVL70003.1 hypothetical protein LOY23_18290 [Pseudomonas protegens]